MPQVFLDDDAHPGRPMARYGVLLGFSVARALWRFGFVTGSDISTAFGVCTRTPLYVLCWHTGRVVETALLPWSAPPPARFLHVVEARLTPAPTLVRTGAL